MQRLQQVYASVSRSVDSVGYEYEIVPILCLGGRRRSELRGLTSGNVPHPTEDLKPIPVRRTFASRIGEKESGHRMLLG
jgi:hypothetical protein